MPVKHPDNIDIVARYGLSRGWNLKSRIVLVEGTTDEALFALTDKLYFQKTGIHLLSDDISIVAAGERDLGGTRGVVRELITLRGLASTALSPNGRPIYRTIALFDNDKMGIGAVSGAKNIDSSIVEYKDVFRLHPIMPLQGNLDPKTLARNFETLNAPFKGLDWEIEDLLFEGFFDSFAADNPFSVNKQVNRAGFAGGRLV